MKKLFVISAFVATQYSMAQEVKWYTFDEAIEAQKTNPKKIVVDVYAPWCGPCKMMEKTTFTHPEIVKILNESYYPVKFNGEGNETIHYKGMVLKNKNYRNNSAGRNSLHDFTRYLGIGGYPTLAFFDEEANLITNLTGGFSAKELEPYLSFIQTDTYKKVTTKEEWENYQKKFKSKIKD